MKTAYAPNFSAIAGSLDVIPFCFAGIDRLKLGDVRKNEIDYCGGTTVNWDRQRQMRVGDLGGSPFPFADSYELLWEDELGYWWPDSELIWASSMEELRLTIIYERNLYEEQK